MVEYVDFSIISGCFFIEGCGRFWFLLEDVDSGALCGCVRGVVLGVVVGFLLRGRLIVDWGFVCLFVVFGFASGESW